MPDEGSSTGQPNAALAAGDTWAARVSLGVQRGDRTALAEFYDAWFDRSLALTAKATGRDESFCLDVVQDAMVKAAGSLKRVETEGQLSVWMRRVLLSCALDRLREETARSRRQRAARSEQTTQREDARHAERLEWLEQELRKVSGDEMILLRQKLVHNKTLEEAGGLIGATGSVAHGRVRRLIEALRRAGKARFGDA